MTVAFSLVYVSVAFTLKYLPLLRLHSSAEIRHKAANHATGFIFSTLFLFMVGYNLLYQQSPVEYCEVTTRNQLRLVQLSFSYFSFDLLRLLWLEPQQYLWLLHHIISLLYTCSVMQAGLCGCGYIIAAAVHEITHPLRSSYHLARLSHNMELFSTLSGVLTWTFVATRTVVIPLVDYDLIVKGFLPSAKAGKLSEVYAIGWSVLAVCMLVLHWCWAWQLVQGFFKLRSGIKQQAMQKQS